MVSDSGKKDINAKGGILGRPVKLLIYDDRSSPEKARVIYLRMLTKEGVDFVLGPYSSSIAREIVPLVEKYHFPTLVFGAADCIWAGRPRYIFGINTSEQRWESAILAFLARHEIDRIGILVDRECMSLGVAKGLKKWAHRFNQTVLMDEAVNVRELGKQVRRAEERGVQGLVHWGYVENAVKIRKALAKVGWYPMIYCSQIAPSLDEYRRILGPLADYSVGTSVWEPSIGNRYPGGKRFVEQFRQTCSTMPSYHAAVGFAAGEILAAAISAAGTTEREKVRNELSVLDMVTIVGRYGVDVNGRQIRQQPLIIQLQEGKKKILQPKDLSNGTLLFPPEARP